MQVGPTGLSFTAIPTGEAEPITLRQEKPNRPIESPFGLLNTTQQEGQFIQNQNTIVWGERTTNNSYTQTFLKERIPGNPRIQESDNTSHLYDTSRQMPSKYRPGYFSMQRLQRIV
ncbi:hypothetical protein OUZ56_011737 [Daphnia magna]|uniref:Uncharacterized protein n=1 Tax=Daphnia magna TaxID=35525 RepID=A0ABQ9Z113_9CRUS|nr:hypothetical protein OUZ56_011737 [Daphnia magna]